ncbi:MAG: hypothetical protein CM15mP89_3730 [Gammaproteobacteria bacterium]|nr:MAG: hypothetical protein CM15mP89_3730 [Gammaproteobacteria bacterium]
MLDGQRFDDGPILAASFTNRGETFEAYRYTDLEGDTSYYNEKGVSMRKAFLRAPLDFTRVSSNFNPNRLHPIYKTQRPHRGTDYAAPRGTPVYAAGDGRVIEAGYTRPNGRYVFIQHGEQFETHYLHLHKLKVKKGDRVKQGAVIGTVGSTGAATGHIFITNFLVNGVHRNPAPCTKFCPRRDPCRRMNYRAISRRSSSRPGNLPACATRSNWRSRVKHRYFIGLMSAPVLMALMPCSSRRKGLTATLWAHITAPCLRHCGTRSSPFASQVITNCTAWRYWISCWRRSTHQRQATPRRFIR